MPTWDELYAQGLAWTEPHARVVEALPELRRAGVQRALDLGCGTGRHLVWLEEHGIQAWGSDIAPHGLAYARAQLEHEHREARLLLADMAALPFAAAAFGAVLSIQVLYHGTRAKIDAAIAEARRVLRPGGVFVVSFLSTRTWKYGEGVRLEPDTFVQERGPEAGVPHHYCDEVDVRRHLAGFAITALRLDERDEDGERHCHWEAVARRR